MTASTPAPEPPVVCIDNAGFPASLDPHRIYRALRDDDAAAAAGDLPDARSHAPRDRAWPALVFVRCRSDDSVDGRLVTDADLAVGVDELPQVANWDRSKSPTARGSGAQGCRERCAHPSPSIRYAGT